jgi:predicted aspartyl protease
MTGGSTIKAVNYPTGKTPPLFADQDEYRPTALRKKTLQTKTGPRPALFSATSTAPVTATVIDSPPVDGFVPWIAVAVTDKRLDDLELNATPETSVVGNYLTSSPETSYAIGIFDTGASAHVMSDNDAARAGVFDYTPDLITSSLAEVSGVTGSVRGWVSKPLGLFVDGLGAIEPNGMLLDDSDMVGEFNVSIIVGDPIESPNLPTAIGSPLSVYFTAVFRNDQQITVIRDSNEFTSPDIRFYESYDPCIPDYSNTIALELRPTGTVSVQYFPNILDPFDPDFGAPMSPSVITGFLPSQSLFFVSSVDLAHKDRSAIDKDGFMLDTGAQVSVISEAIAARLGLSATNADFEVEIQGVSGDVIMAPGFYIDSLEITATPEWLSFTNVPVIMLDVDSPEGGTLEGIIGMNLFTRFNLVLRGGGLLGQDPPSLEFELIYIIADIAPAGGDGVVNSLDLAAFAEAWLATTGSANWNPNADMAPPATNDGLVNFLDFAVFAEDWPSTTAP